MEPVHPTSDSPWTRVLDRRDVLKLGAIIAAGGAIAPLPPALGATEGTSFLLGAAHAASSGATTPPAAMTAPSLSTSRRLRMRIHGLSLSG